MNREPEYPYVLVPADGDQFTVLRAKDGETVHGPASFRDCYQVARQLDYDSRVRLLSSADLIDRAGETIARAQHDLRPFERDGEPVPYDWTNLQGAENELLAALVYIRLAKVGVIRRNPSFRLPDFAMVEADLARAVGSAMDNVLTAADLEGRI